MSTVLEVAVVATGLTIVMVGLLTFADTGRIPAEVTAAAALHCVLTWDVGATMRVVGLCWPGRSRG